MVAWPRIAGYRSGRHHSTGELAASQRQLVPAYFHPHRDGSPNDWYRMSEAFSALPGASIAVMNPSSGPGLSAKPDYLPVIDHCRDSGHHVIGYVHTSYGARPLAAVREEVDAYYRFYPTIDGIFLDEMSNEPSTSPYYKALFGYIHSKSEGPHVVGNPGVPATTAWQLVEAVADELVLFEGRASTYLSWTPPRWVFDYAPSTFANLIFDAPDDAVGRVRAHSHDVNAGYVYITHASLPNPWGVFA
jgi:hypothetical protein